MNLSTPQYVLPDHVCPFAVRVAYTLSLADFLGSMITCTQVIPKDYLYFHGSARKVDLPAFLIAYALKRPIPSGRGSVTAPSPHHCICELRNINRICHRLRRSAET